MVIKNKLSPSRKPLVSCLIISDKTPQRIRVVKPIKE